MSGLKCILCFSLLEKPNDRTKVDGRGDFKAADELSELPVSISRTSEHICRKCLSQLKKWRGLKESLSKLDKEIVEAYTLKCNENGLEVKPNHRSAKGLFQETDNVSALSLTKDSGKTGFNWNSLGTSGCKYMKNDHGQNVGAVSESLKEIIPPKAPSSLKMQSPSTPATPVTPGRLVTSTPMRTLKISNPFTPAPLVSATMSLTPLRISNKNETMHYFFSSSTQRNDNSRMTYQTMALLEDPSP